MGERRRKKGERRKETEERRREIEDGRKETGDRRRDGRKETGERRWERGDVRGSYPKKIPVRYLYPYRSKGTHVVIN